MSPTPRRKWTVEQWQWVKNKVWSNEKIEDIAFWHAECVTWYIWMSHLIYRALHIHMCHTCNVTWLIRMYHITHSACEKAMSSMFSPLKTKCITSLILRVKSRMSDVIREKAMSSMFFPLKTKFAKLRPLNFKRTNSKAVLKSNKDCPPVYVYTCIFFCVQMRQGNNAGN